MRFYRRWEYKEPSLELRIKLDKTQNPYVSRVNPIGPKQTLENCTLNEDRLSWRLTFKKAKSGTLVMRCYSNEKVFEVCDSLCGYTLLEVDRFTLSKDFGPENVKYLQDDSGSLIKIT